MFSTLTHVLVGVWVLHMRLAQIQHDGFSNTNPSKARHDIWMCNGCMRIRKFEIIKLTTTTSSRVNVDSSTKVIVDNLKFISINWFNHMSSCILLIFIFQWRNYTFCCLELRFRKLLNDFIQWTYVKAFYHLYKSNLFLLLFPSPIYCNSKEKLGQLFVGWIYLFQIVNYNRFFVLLLYLNPWGTEENCLFCSNDLLR